MDTRTTGNDAFARGAADAAAGGGSGGGGVVGDAAAGCLCPPSSRCSTLPAPCLASRRWATRWRRGWFWRWTPRGTPRRCTRRRLSRRRATRTPRRAPRRETLRRSLAGRRGGERGARALAEGPADGADGVPAASGSRLTPGTPEGNGEFARAAMALKERHLRPAPRARGVPAPRHAAGRGGGAPEAEARVLREGLASVLQRRETLARRLERAKGAHADARGCGGWRRWSGPSRGRRRRRRAARRLCAPPRRTRRCSARSWTSSGGGRRRCGRTRELPPKTGAENASAENAGARVSSGARFAKPDPADAAVREELRAQEAAIRRNAARAEALASR